MKAQVTLFIIVGLFILVSFGLLMYFLFYQEAAGWQRSLPEQSFKRAVMESVRSYINNCLAETSAQALEFLGKQGGRLYESQGGIANDPIEFISYEGFNVSYSVLPPSGTAGDYTSVVPMYPWTRFPWIIEDGQDSEWLYGFYGFPNFPPLYKFSPGSIQQMLETYIENNIPKCVDWSSFKGISFDTGIPKARMIIAKNLSQLYTEEFVSFALDWPVTATDAPGSKTELTEFATNYPVSFGKIYYNAKSLIDSDVSDISFDPSNYAGFDVSVARDANSLHDDIIIFTDKKSKLIGKPFSFWIARKNRAPALVFVNESVARKNYCFGTRFSIDANTLMASAGQLSYPLKAFDPDEDTVSFHLDPDRPELISNSMTFRVIAGDQALEDYQDITVHGVACE